MAENSKIEWTHHTFNPWTGCTKISPACDHCYAERWAKRSGHVKWGPNAERQRTKPGTWHGPEKWNSVAGKTGQRLRVFCASLSDVFDNHRSIKDHWREDLWDLIYRTPNLDWLLLTKRPQNIEHYLPKDWGRGWPHVWLGTTVEDQTEANRRIPYLLRVPAKVRFLSCEPMLGPIDLTHVNDDSIVMIDALRGLGGWPVAHAEVGPRIHWVIAGGESGAKYRPADPNWFRSLRNQCADAGVPFLFKQWEGTTQKIIKAKGRELDGVVHDGYPVPA